MPNKDLKFAETTVFIMVSAKPLSIFQVFLEGGKVHKKADPKSVILCKKL